MVGCAGEVLLLLLAVVVLLTAALVALAVGTKMFVALLAPSPTVASTALDLALCTAAVLAAASKGSPRGKGESRDCRGKEEEEDVDLHAEVYCVGLNEMIERCGAFSACFG